MKAQNYVLIFCAGLAVAVLCAIWRQQVLHNREDIVLKFEQEIRSLESQKASGITIAKAYYYEAIAIRKWDQKKADDLVNLADTLVASERAAGRADTAAR